MLNSFINFISLQWLVLGVVNTGMLMGCSISPSPLEDTKPTLGILSSPTPPTPNWIYQVNTSPPTYLSPQKCYQVKSGDNLYRIGKAYGVSYEQLANWNGLTVSRWDGGKPVYDLAPGQQLKITSYATCY